MNNPPAKFTEKSLWELREVAERAWKERLFLSANIPFYVEVKKPRASMSKHDDKRPHYWHYDDGLFLTVFQPFKVLELLDEIEWLRRELTITPNE